jgi:hypothetical protein
MREFGTFDASVSGFLTNTGHASSHTTLRGSGGGAW